MQCVHCGKNFSGTYYQAYNFHTYDDGQLEAFRNAPFCSKKCLRAVTDQVPDYQNLRETYRLQKIQTALERYNAIENPTPDDHYYKNSALNEEYLPEKVVRKRAFTPMMIFLAVVFALAAEVCVGLPASAVYWIFFDSFTVPAIISFVLLLAFSLVGFKIGLPFAKNVALHSSTKDEDVFAEPEAEPSNNKKGESASKTSAPVAKKTRRIVSAVVERHGLDLVWTMEDERGDLHTRTRTYGGGVQVLGFTDTTVTVRSMANGQKSVLELAPRSISFLN